MPAGSGRYPSGQRGQTVNLLAYAFGGSNPPLPTNLFRGNSSAVERQPSKLGVAGSNPVSRSIVATGGCPGRDVGGLFEMEVAPIRPGRDVGGLFEVEVAPIRPSERRRRPAQGFARSIGSARRHRSVRDSIDSAHVAQLAEHALGKGEVSGSIPDMGSRFLSPTKCGAHGR